MKTVLITGASRGIGAAIARRFADGNHNIVINYNRSKTEAEAVARKVGGYSVRADVGNPAEVEQMMSGLDERFGGVDVLINNAGVSHIGLFTDMTEDEWQKIINVNLGGAFRVTRCAAKGMISRHSGCIINISSMWGQTGASCEVAYSAAKAGIIGMTKALAKELGPSHIRVNCIAPGMIETDMNSKLPPDVISDIVGETPLMRIGNPEDIAEAAYFLCGRGGEFITGQIIGINGGLII